MEERKELTKRQEEVLNYIKKYIAEHGYPQAVREICAGIGLNSMTVLSARMLIWKTDLCELLLKRANQKNSVRF